MKALLATITALSLFGSTPQAPEPSCTHGHHDHEITTTVTHVARRASFRAVCARGDLNSVFPSRSAAIRAAQAHQQRTGHRTGVRKQ